MATLGAVSVAFGAKARAAVQRAANGLRRYNPDIPLTVIGDTPPDGVDCNFVTFATPGFGARWAKLNLLDLTPYDFTLYLDADTEPLGDLHVGFQILADGYDLAIAPSINQDGDVLAHIDNPERAYTLERVFLPLQLQAGVLFIARNAITVSLLAHWQEEWQRYAQHDQAALLRALETAPARIWLLGRAWNGGELIAHHFGEARQ